MRWAGVAEAELLLGLNTCNGFEMVPFKFINVESVLTGKGFLKVYQ